MMAKAFRYFTGLMLLVMVMAVSVPAQTTEETVDIGGTPLNEIDQGKIYTFRPDINKDGGGGLTWDLQPLPDWLNLDEDENSEGVTVTGTPSNEDVGTYTNLQLSATAPDGDFDTIIFTIEVRNTNDRPEVISTQGSKSATEGEPFDYSITIEDIDGYVVDPADTLEWTIGADSVIPNWIRIGLNKVESDGTVSDTLWTLSLEGDPTNDDVGEVSFTIIIDDNKGGQLPIDIAFDVFNVNNKPERILPSSLDNEKVNQDSPYTVTLGIQDEDILITNPDPDATPEALTIRTSTLPDWLTFDPDPPAPDIQEDVYYYTLTGTPGNSDVTASNRVYIEFMDTEGATETVDYIINVINVNDPPVISGAPPDNILTVNQGDESWQFTPEATDPDPGENVLNFSIENQPTWLNFDPTTGRLSAKPGEPKNKYVGEYPGIFITVSDSSSATDVLPEDPNVFPNSTGLTIVVQNINDPPNIIEPAEGLPPMKEGQSYTYTFTATDIDLDRKVTNPEEQVDPGEELTFSVVSPTTLPAWLTFTNNDDNTATLATPTDGEITAPGNRDVGTITDFKVRVTDGERSDTFTFDLVIQNSNNPPVFEADPAPKTSVDEDKPYSFIPAVTDLDMNLPEEIDVDPNTPDINENEKLTYSLAEDSALLPPWAELDPVTGELSGTPENKHVGRYAGIILEVKDIFGETDTLGPFSITVNPVNDDPVMNCIYKPRIGVGQLYGFEFSATDIDFDLIGNPDTLTYKVDSKPAWLNLDVDLNTNKITGVSGTPKSGDVGTHTFVVSVRDDKGATDSCTLTIEVLEELTVNPGDINGTGDITLDDVIYGLQILTGIEVGYVYMEGDVNADDKIGLEEILYDLRVISQEPTQ